MDITCKVCSKLITQPKGAITRALKKGLNLYCDKVCAGIGRQLNKTSAQKKEEKRIYDMEYRAKNIDKLKQKKAIWFKESYNPKEAAEKRKARMPYHVEYCRQPEYKSYKKQYDRRYRAYKNYGEFGECFLITQDIDGEIASRIDNYNLYLAKGTINKSQQRKREYDRTNSNRS